MPKTLSIIIPCYNEEDTILELIRRVERADVGEVRKQLVIVDDGSTDSTAELLRTKAAQHTLLIGEKNQGKGAAIRRGLEAVTGDIVIIQDADLEYNPDNYAALIAPILAGKTPVVYGSRERNAQNRLHSGMTYYAGGKFLSAVTNLLYGSEITDEPTCYKVFDAALLKSLPLQCTGFEFCPEVTARVLRRDIVIEEVPIDYFPRKKNEGKKIRWRDGIEAVWTLIRYRFAREV
ncbi:MAG: glycosyltransferase family 2 protein [Bacteroidetes bacterium]|nr:glycosyltransferase family 2 protein [Bacteroidota bacterium]